MKKPFNTDRSLRHFQLIGYLSVFLVVGVGGSWATLASINGAVIAPAIIVAESNTKKIQHKEGGIVKEILVKDGDRVVEGQSLITLDDTDTKADLGIVDALLLEAMARRARLEAQRDQVATVAFPPEIEARKDEPEVASIMRGQVRLFESRSATIKGKKEQLLEQVGQITEQITGMAAQINAKERQIELIKDDLVDLHNLLEKGLMAKSRVLGMERELARLEGERGEVISQKAGAASRIGETKLRVLQIDEEELTQTLADLRDTEGKIAEYRERKNASTARLGRTAIKAPITGVVYQLTVHTIGGVIQPAEGLMLIVPEADELVLQAQVSPQNISQVEVGQKAHVRFPAFNSRRTPEVFAHVTQVAADTSRSDQSSPSYYLVRLQISADELVKLTPNKLRPGMPAEAFIQTDARSPLSYFIKPLMDQFAHTFRER